MSLQFMDKETEAHKGEATCLKSSSKLAGKQRMQLPASSHVLPFLAKAAAPSLPVLCASASPSPLLPSACSLGLRVPHISMPQAAFSPSLSFC